MFVPNFKLNFGGIVGAVACLIGAIAIMALLKFPAGGGTPYTLAIVAGAVLGNWIWSLALPDRDERG